MPHGVRAVLCGLCVLIMLAQVVLRWSEGRHGLAFVALAGAACFAVTAAQSLRRHRAERLRPGRAD